MWVQMEPNADEDPDPHSNNIASSSFFFKRNSAFYDINIDVTLCQTVRQCREGREEPDCGDQVHQLPGHCLRPVDHAVQKVLLYVLKERPGTEKRTVFSDIKMFCS